MIANAALPFLTESIPAGALPDDGIVLASLAWKGHSIFVHKMTWFTKGYRLASPREGRTLRDQP